ncbi:MAG: hypothetical protein H6713_09410 [Myxococcales bacterium]|nr:hypothetical protein [Myxococcales bacterium]MCB9750205.1 hypothetical protein [Myxococcales bacterium]
MFLERAPQEPTTPRAPPRARTRTSIASTVALTLTLTTVTIGRARAGAIAKHGAVQALDHASQIQNLTGAADFDEGVHDTPIPLDAYAVEGGSFHVGPLSAALSGVTSEGSSSQPAYYNWLELGYFPGVIDGGGLAAGLQTHFAGVITFSGTVTQFGLTASSSGEQHITAWDHDGAMIGQVDWTPAGDAAFVGLDTLGVPIAMIAYGNDDLWAGEAYSVAGAAIISDSWRWGLGTGCVSNADCDDGDPCTGVEQCEDGVCVSPEQSLDCDDDNPCTDDVCEPGVGCVNEANNNPCDDGDLCTQDDACAAGVCGGEARACDDGLLCTATSCDPARGCVSEAIAGCCEHDDDCDADERCDLDANACVPGSGSTTDALPETTGDAGGSGTSDPGGGDDDDGDDIAQDSATDSSGAGDTITEDGCGCQSPGPADPASVVLVMLALLPWRRRRRRG